MQTSATVNEVQLLGSQSGEPIVPMYQLLGSRIKKVPLISSYHHFEFHSTSKGKVTREYDSSSSERTLMTATCFRAEEFPDVIDHSSWSLEPFNGSGIYTQKFGNFVHLTAKIFLSQASSTVLVSATSTHSFAGTAYRKTTKFSPFVQKLWWSGDRRTCKENVWLVVPSLHGWIPGSLCQFLHHLIQTCIGWYVW